MPTLTEVTPEQLFHEHLPLIERAAAHASRRYHLLPEEAEDFASEVKFKVFANDYEVIRRFEGREGSSLGTYLGSVVHHHMLDYINHLWGKWRPSAEAKRLGPVAIQLERLLIREKLTLNEACETLLTNHRVEMSRQALEDLAARLPSRTGRHIVGEEALEPLEDQGSRADQGVITKERQAIRRRAFQSLDRALAALSAEDRLILKLRSGKIPVNAIARRLGLEEKPLYRRIERIHRCLREAMERDGIDRKAIRDILGEEP